MVVTGKLKAVPTLAVYEPALVTAGIWSMVSVNPWVTVPAALVAVTERSNTPARAGVPARVAVPLPLSTNVTPVGRAPVSSRAGSGVPVAVTGKENAVPKATVSDPALVIAGACSMVSVKLWVTVPTALAAVMMKVEVPRVVGVPERVAVPLAPATKVTPGGRAPASVSVGAG